jgi:hypothetical protein
MRLPLRRSDGGWTLSEEPPAKPIPINNSVLVRRQGVARFDAPAARENRRIPTTLGELSVGIIKAMYLLIRAFLAVRSVFLSVSPRRYCWERHRKMDPSPGRMCNMFQPEEFERQPYSEWTILAFARNLGDDCSGRSASLIFVYFHVWLRLANNTAQSTRGPFGSRKEVVRRRGSALIGVSQGQGKIGPNVERPTAGRPNRASGPAGNGVAERGSGCSAAFMFRFSYFYLRRCVP